MGITNMPDAKPHILLIIARGEAVRNFLYSDTLPALCQHARVTLLSVLHDEKFVARFGGMVDRIVPLNEHPEHWIVRVLRELILMAHYRWIWTEKVKNKWDLLDMQAKTPWQKFRNRAFKGFAFQFLLSPDTTPKIILFTLASFSKHPMGLVLLLTSLNDLSIIFVVLIFILMLSG